MAWVPGDKDVAPHTIDADGTINTNMTPEQKTYYSTPVPHVWVTKYALTRGILRYDTVEPHQFGVMVLCPSGKWQLYYEEAEGCDWHRTEAAALVRVQEMRDEELAALMQRKHELESWKPIIKVYGGKP